MSFNNGYHYVKKKFLVCTVHPWQQLEKNLTKMIVLLAIVLFSVYFVFVVQVVSGITKTV